MELDRWIDHWAAREPDRPALDACDGRYAYGALARRRDEIAAALAAAGIGPGDVVAWLGLNSAAMVTTLFACARLGAIFMPMNWRLAPPEHHAMLQSARPSLLVADDPFTAACTQARVAGADTRCIALGATVPEGWATWDDLLEHAAAPPRPAAVGADAPLLLCYTSGSTGAPKGVMLTHDALDANADASVDMHGLRSEDHVLCTLPLFHVGGLNIQTTPALREGARVTLQAKFDPDAAFDAIERERITLTVLVPAQLDAMMASPRWAGADFSSLRMISTGSTLVPDRLISAVHRRGVPLIQVWGATETCPIASALHADESVAKAGSAGRAALGVQLRIVDVQGRDVPAGGSGEILVRGRSVMSGYWCDAPASARALQGGWYHSGDSGHLDAEGFLWVDGRLKDMIISGGENVSPAEVEAVLADAPGVAEVGVVGAPDERWGEVVVAVVAARPGSTLTEAELLARYDGRLARYKSPKRVLFVDALPRTALGKVRKDELRQWVAKQAAATRQERIG